MVKELGLNILNRKEMLVRRMKCFKKKKENNIWGKFIVDLEIRSFVERFLMKLC